MAIPESEVYRLDHVAIGVHDVAAATPFLVGELGGRRHGAGPGGGYRFWQWSFANGTKLEVLEPTGPAGGFLHRFLDTHGPGIHHVTFKVPELRRAIAHAEEHGYEVVGVNEALPGWKEAFLHPKQAQGIVVQLAESEPARQPTPEQLRAWPFPDEPEPRRDAVDLLGVRLVAHSRQAARRQWGSVLRGRCEETGDLLVFRWPDSPLRIAVAVEPDAEEGPRALEIRARSGLTLPEGPHPLLGTCFLDAEPEARAQ
jgi:methylmalonyl-CoA/ethylmalonyl-CoA epimerase